MRRRAAAGRQQARRLQAAGLRRPRPRLERQVRSGSQPLSQDGPRRWHRCVPPARLQAGSHLVVRRRWRTEPHSCPRGAQQPGARPWETGPHQAVRRRWRTVPHGCPRSVHCPLWQAASPADPTAADHGRKWARCPLERKRQTGPHLAVRHQRRTMPHGCPRSECTPCGRSHQAACQSGSAQAPDCRGCPSASWGHVSQSRGGCLRAGSHPAVRDKGCPHGCPRCQFPALRAWRPSARPRSRTAAALRGERLVAGRALRGLGSGCAGGWGTCTPSGRHCRLGPAARAKADLPPA